VSFALVTDDLLVAWEDGKVQGFPAEALVDAELALRQETVAATPTGPWFERGTPEAAYLALRKLWPHSEVEGDPPKIGPYGDELASTPALTEARYVEGLHPRDRRGRWRKKERAFAQMLRQTMSMKASTVAGTARRRAERGYDPSLPRLHYVGFEQMVLKHGLLFKHGPDVTPTEREYSATTPKECFLNATHAALEHRDLTYVEGYAYNGLLPIHHAWLVDENGVVHDPTWASMQGREGEADIYIGIPFKTDWLLGYLGEKETYGVYGEWGEGLKLTEPIPEDAIETGVKGLPVPEEMHDPDPEIMGMLAKARTDYERRQTEADLTGSSVEKPDETFTDTGRAQAWFQERWPDKKFSFEGADMTVLGPALAHFVELADRFPFAIRGDRFGGIQMSSPTDPDDFSRKLSADAHAGVRRDDNMLLLNPASWGDPTEFNDALEAAELAEWHPPGAAIPTAMMTHEFGHLLDRALTAEKDTAWKEPYSEAWGGHGKVSGDWLAWKKDADVLAVSGYAQRASRGAFGATDNSERVAEAFSSVFHTPDELKDEYVQRFEALLGDLADESKWVPATNDRSINFQGERTGGRPPLTDEDKKQWNEERLDWMAQRYGSLWTVKNDRDGDRYRRFYPDSYQEAVSALYDRRRARTAELRQRASERKKAKEEQRLAGIESRRTAELDKWLPRKKELEAEGLEGPEILERLKAEGFDPRLLNRWFDPAMLR
jgi:hypothetical protein